MSIQLGSETRRLGRVTAATAIALTPECPGTYVAGQGGRTLHHSCFTSWYIGIVRSLLCRLICSVAVAMQATHPCLSNETVETRVLMLAFALVRESSLSADLMRGIQDIAGSYMDLAVG
jgi:hypothetical protein